MNENETKITYKNSGVDYSSIDPFKIMAQKSAFDTKNNIVNFADGTFTEYTPSRGESVYLVENKDSYIAHVEEGLGTKNLIADEMYKLTGKSYYDQIAKDTVAMIVNDMITMGALPLSVAMHLAVGDSNWFNDTKRCQDLVDGWNKACDLSRCVWGGGETPTLKGIISGDASLLSGSAVGIVYPKEKLITSKISHGDSIVIIESSGIHANGLTLARFIKDKLPDGYMTKLSDGRTYGETLLDPTHIYVPLVADCLVANIDIHYALNVTGHGWRKLMRSNQEFTYVIDRLPTNLPIFDFICEHGNIDKKEAYGNFNMGAGFVLYVDKDDAQKVIDIASKLGFVSFVAGSVKAGDKKIIIEPHNIEFAGDTLKVR